MNRPKLVILVGPPGCGKSTYATKYIEENINTIHLSSDGIRKELWGDEAIQGDNSEVFSLMQTRAIDALNNGQNVIYDATNMTRKDRSYIIELCPKFVKIEAHIIWAPIETCIERDAARERTVSKTVIDKMLKRFQPVWFDEGVDEIEVISPEDFDSDVYTSEIQHAMKIPHDNPHHTANILDHCFNAYHYATDKNFDVDIRYAALFHDIGKPYTKAFIDSHGNPCETAHYYSHHNISGWLAYGLSNMTPLRVWLVGVHMDPYMNTKYYRRLPAYLKEKVDLLHEADRIAH